jgi:5-formyltetrahydrofolate cyclo-ligase
MAKRLQDEAIAHDPVKARALADNFLRHFSNLDPATVISGAMAIRHEIDASVLMQALAGKGHTLCLPVLTEKYQPLKFRLYTPGDALEKKIWGLTEPPDTAPEVTPDILLCPLLAFDRQGQRLGYGAGYYDATLSALRAQKKITANGFAHALQEVPAVPVNTRDQRLDAIVTEKEVILPPAGQDSGLGL